MTMRMKGIIIKMSNNSRRLIVCSVGDTTANAEAEKTFAAIANEKPDIFRFLGDTSYEDNNGTGWNKLIDKLGLKSIMQMHKGNHEDKEEDAEKCGEDH
jgi:phosphodiesterase/alkaline phosphatase D-like protein